MEDRLVKFARIVEAGSFTRAATLLHISQPALTTAVKKLERELQAELLIRGSHTLTLTTAGSIAYETAKALITQTQNLETSIREAADQKSTLNLGMIDSLATLLFIEKSYLGTLEQGAQVSLTIDNSSRLIEQIKHNELDVALVAQPGRLQASLSTEIIGEEPLILVARPDSIAQLKREMKDGRLTHFMSYNQASRTYQIIAEHFTDAKIVLQPTFYSTSPEIMLQLMLSQGGAAVLPYLLVRPQLAVGSLQAIRIGKSPIIRRTIISLRRSGRLLSAQTILLLEHTKTELHTLNSEASNI